MDVPVINPLTLLPLELLQRRNLPHCSAIYLVLNYEQILYTERANSLLKRWSKHYIITDRETFINVFTARLKCSRTIFFNKD